MTTVIAERYEILRLIGEGGMARVYSAHDRKYDREVAIKVLRNEIASVLGSARFLREIHIAAKLSHPNILPLYDSGEADGTLYYVMPLMLGESLRTRLERDGPLSVPQAVRVTQEIAEALTYAHEQGFVHRDIKPDNIMLERGHALVADFGIARALTGWGGSKLTSTGMSLGTPLYMSPEQAFNDPTLNYSTDIYSLGCVVFEMLAGRPPFTGDTAQAVLARHIAEPVDMAGLPAGVPSGVIDSLTRALAKRAADRFPTAVAFSSALVAAAQSESTVITPDRRTVGKATTPRRRRLPALVRWHYWVLGTLVLLAAVGLYSPRTLRGAFYYWITPKPQPLKNGFPHTGIWYGTYQWPEPVVNVGDTAVALQQEGVLLVFNGETWSRRLLPFSDPVLASVQGNLWIFSSRRAGPAYRLGANGWVLADSIPISVATVWSHDESIIVANTDGEFAERTPRGWRRIPSGRQARITSLFGSDRAGLTGTGSFAGHSSNPDSLVRLEGGLWQAYDPRPDGTGRWTYREGADLDSGSAIVVGFEEKDTLSVPLVLVGKPEEQRWQRIAVPVDSAQGRFDHVVRIGANNALMWGEDLSGLVEWQGDTLKSVPLFANRYVRGATLLHGSPVVFTDAGTLFIRRGRWFEVFGEIPIDVSLALIGMKDGERLALATRLGSPSYPSLRKALRVEGRLWALATGGSLLSAGCVGRACEARVERAQPEVIDFASSGDTVTALGRNGVLTQWNGSGWKQPDWASTLKGRVLTLVAIAPNGATVVTGPDSAFLIGTGQRFSAIPYNRPLSPLRETSPGAPTSVAMGDSNVAFLWPEQVLLLRSGAKGPFTERSWFSVNSTTVFTAGTWTCDGNLVLVSAALADPLIGGQVIVLQRPGKSDVFPATLPIPLDLTYGNISRGSMLLLGRGDMWMGTDSLFAVPQCELEAAATEH